MTTGMIPCCERASEVQVASAPKLVYRVCRGAQVSATRKYVEMALGVRKSILNTKMAIPLALVAAPLMLSGCNITETLNPRTTLTQGYVADQEALDLVPVGSSREQVLLALGTPSTTATFDNEAFYYISQKRVKRAAFMKAKIVDQRILAVYFGEDERVTNIAQYGLQDGKVFDFLSKTTPTGGKDNNFIGQLLSGLGSGQAPTLSRP